MASGLPALMAPSFKRYFRTNRDHECKIPDDETLRGETVTVSYVKSRYTVFRIILYSIAAFLFS